MPPRYLAHLEPDFPHWLKLAVELVKRAADDDQFVVLPTELPIPDLVERLSEARVEDGDLVDERGPGHQSLRITYAQDGTEEDRFLMVATGRFLLEVSLDLQQRPLWLRLAVSYEDDEEVSNRLMPWTGALDVMVG